MGGEGGRGRWTFNFRVRGLFGIGDRGRDAPQTVRGEEPSVSRASYNKSKAIATALTLPLIVSFPTFLILSH